MSDKQKHRKGYDNIRGLIQDVAEKSDAMSNELRKQTVFADTRPSDAKTFMLISRHPRGLSDLARALGITRQAAHRSLQRLIGAGVVSYDYVEGSKRDMIASVTEKGLEARKVGVWIGTTVEDRIKDRIGADDLEALRRILKNISNSDFETQSDDKPPQT